MNKIKTEHFEHYLEILNVKTNNPLVYKNENGEINIGHYHISGNNLYKTCSSGGAVNYVAASDSKRELLEYIKILIRFIDLESIKESKNAN